MFAAWLRGGLRKIRIHHNHLTQIHRSRPRPRRRRFCFILFPFSFSSPCSVLYWQPATNIEIKCLFCILFWRMASAKIIYAASGVSFACATPMPPSKEEIVQPTYLPTSVSFSPSLSLPGLPASQKQMTAMGTTTNETHKNTLKVFTFDLEKIIHFRANKKPKQQQKQQQKQPALACG